MATLYIQTISSDDKGSSSKPYAFFQIGPSAAAGTFFAYAYGNNIQCYTSGYVGIGQNYSTRINTFDRGGTNGDPAEQLYNDTSNTNGYTYFVFNCTGASTCTITFSASGTTQFQGTFKGWSSSSESVPSS